MKREKTVFDRDELSHVWASQSQKYGKARSTNMHFDEETIFSYSTAIGRIGKHKGKQYVLINMHSFGPTTAKHQGDASRATSHMKQFRGDWGSYGTRMDLLPKDVVSHYETEGDEKAKETHKQKRMMFQILSGAIAWYGKALDAAEFFGFGVAKIKAKIKKCHEQMEAYREAYESWDSKHTASVEQARATKRRNEALADARREEERRVELEAFLADYKVEDKDVPSEWTVPKEKIEAYRAQKIKRGEWKAEMAKEDLEKWCNGEEVQSSLWNLPVRLRARKASGVKAPFTDCTPVEIKNEIETSHGAVIPYEDGRRAFQFIMRHKGKAWSRNGEKCPVGHYQIDRIEEDGSIKAGCHVIQFSEILRFSIQEGWVNNQSTEEK